MIKSKVEITELYAFFNILELTLANIEALGFCQISLSDILPQEVEFGFFMQVFNAVVIKLSDELNDSTNRVTKATNEEEKVIW